MQERMVRIAGLLYRTTEDRGYQRENLMIKCVPVGHDGEEVFFWPEELREAEKLGVVKYVRY